MTSSTAGNQEKKTELEGKSTYPSWTPLLPLSLVPKETLCAKEMGRDG